jgi:hypothetical protein
MSQGLRVEDEAAAARGAFDETQVRKQARLGHAQVGREPTVRLAHFAGPAQLTAKRGGHLSLGHRRRCGFETRGRELPSERGEQGDRGGLFGGGPEDLARVERREGGHEALRTGSVRRTVIPFSGRDVDRGVRPHVPRQGDDAHEEIVFGASQDPVLDDGSGGDDTGDLPSNQPLRETRVLDLVADRHLVPFADQPSEVRLDRVVRHAGHRGPDPEGIRGPSREHDVQLARQEARIVPERLVEVPDAKEDEVSGVSGLDALILLEEWSQGRDVGHRTRGRAVVGI